MGRQEIVVGNFECSDLSTNLESITDRSSNHLILGILPESVSLIEIKQVTSWSDPHKEQSELRLADEHDVLFLPQVDANDTGPSWLANDASPLQLYNDIHDIENEGGSLVLDNFKYLQGFK